MRPIQILAPVVGLIATAKAGGLSTVWTTVVETDYTTYCPVCEMAINGGLLYHDH